MDNISIPSPSVILTSSPPPPSSSHHHRHHNSSSKPVRRSGNRTPPKSSTPAIPASAKKPPASDPVISPATNKPKQSKSRNGCATCKIKRLKCDESKPTCVQCKKRGVQCGGYKKEFKWRPFEEGNLAVNRSAAKVKKGVSQSGSKPAESANTTVLTPPETERSTSPIEIRPPIPMRALSPTSTGLLSIRDSPIQSNSLPSSKSDFHRLSGRGAPTTDAENFPRNIDTGIPGSSQNFSFFPECDAAEASPWLSDLFIAGDDEKPGFEHVSSSLDLAPQSVPAKMDGLSFSALLQGDPEDAEEIVRQSDLNENPWLLPMSGFEESMQWNNEHATFSLINGPRLGPASPEVLTMRFDRLTCGILSIKDGVSENPWRTLVWPMAKDTPALYHAVFALAAFHSCKENEAFRVCGMEHMRQSITCMVQGIQNMRTDAALATSLALAFADTWDQHTRTCIQHLRGAKALVSQVLKDGMQSGFGGGNLERVRFLYNTWLYMDVIARLTSLDECGSQSFDFSIFNLPDDAVHEIDPLMGCAATLFPLIDQAVRLIQRVRRSQSNSVALISQAIELKSLVERWEPPEFFEPPEDPTSEVQHGIQTAHAYRWAILLYLHQAVPEMPSEPASALAKRVLILLATVPLRSRTTIIHMFPLLAAGCEAEQGEDRSWVMERWTAIQSRLMLGGVDRCLEVVREVWARRDAFEAEKRRRQLRMGRANSYVTLDNLTKSGLVHGVPGPDDSANGMSGLAESWRRKSIANDGPGASEPRRKSQAPFRLENIEFEKTVRGHLHWVNVMKEWEWEVFIG